IGLGGQATGNFIGLSGGIYTVTVTDINLCTATSSAITITDPPALALSETHIDVTCNGDCDGFIDVTASGGTPLYTYNWNPPACVCEDPANICAGSYSVTVSDANGCTEVLSGIIITEPSAISIDSEASTDINCNGDNDGTITITASGGTGILSYDIGAGAQPTGDFSNLTGGIYTVTVTDVNLCTATSSAFTITDPAVISIDSEASTDITCNGDNDGTITITASGGTGILSYDIGAGAQPTGDFTDLIPGSYSVTVTDANACYVISSTFTITEPSAIVLTETHSDVTTCGGNDGSIDLTVAGGTGGYTFEWTDSGTFYETTEDISSLVAGAYQVVVTDGNLCSEILIVSISEFGAPSIALDSQTDVLCFGNCTGDATISVSGGTSPYTYYWSNGDTGVMADSLCANIYSVTVTDDNSCIAVSSVTILEPTELTATHTTTNETCFGTCNGTATITAVGGTIPLNFDIGMGSQATGDFTALCAGFYSYTVTDVNGCEYIDSFTILPYILSDSITSSSLNCYGDCDAIATVTGYDGSGSYSYNWNNGTTTATTANLCVGSYYVTLTDDITGCFIVDTIIITEPSQLSLVLSSTDDNGGIGDGTATVMVSGGTPGYTFQWDDPATQTTPTATGLFNGLYTVIVTDTNGCVISDTITVHLYTSVNDINSSSFIKIYPNPSDGLVTIEISKLSEEINVSVFDTKGSLIYYNLYKPESLNKNQIDLSGAEGMYFIKFTGNTFNRIEKIIIR
ncbi:MAG: T9SS type A sorting domain-containing protein, partial [Bacteroidota bacterium]